MKDKARNVHLTVHADGYRHVLMDEYGNYFVVNDVLEDYSAPQGMRIVHSEPTGNDILVKFRMNADTFIEHAQIVSYKPIQ